MRLSIRAMNQSMVDKAHLREDRECEIAIGATLREARGLMAEAFPNEAEREDMAHWLNRALDHILAPLHTWQRLYTTLDYWRDVVKELQQCAKASAYDEEAEEGERSMYRDLRPLGI